MSKNYNPMRKNWIWGLSLLLIGGMASCKSSQSAYKAAYEKAQEKKIEEPVTTGTTPVAEQPVVTAPSTTTTTAPIREQSEKINAVVACSFDDRATAVQAREGLQAKYPQFTDAWFLINK